MEKRARSALETTHKQTHTHTRRGVQYDRKPGLGIACFPIRNLDDEKRNFLFKPKNDNAKTTTTK